MPFFFFKIIVGVGGVRRLDMHHDLGIREMFLNMLGHVVIQFVRVCQRVCGNASAAAQNGRWRKPTAAVAVAAAAHAVRGREKHDGPYTAPVAQSLEDSAMPTLAVGM